MAMSFSLWIVLLLVAAFVLYVVLKVIALNRRSKRDWEQTDKSKLRTIEDEDDW